MLIAFSKSIANLLCTVWFGNSPAFQALSSDAVAYATDKWGASLEKRSADRFFEECADQILSQSANYFKVEFRKIDKDRLDVLLSDIAEAFKNFKLDGRFSAAGYSSEYLTRTIVDNLKLVDRKISAEVKLCENIVERISFYVCQYVQMAPNFVPVSLKQIVENQHEIKLVLDNVVKLTSPLDKDDPNFSGDSGRYLSDIRNSLRMIQIFGLSTHSIRRKYPLESSYISLTVSSQKMGDGFDSGQKVDNFLDDGLRFMVVGPAGSGKSTLLQWAALQCCETYEKSTIPRFSGLVPIFIRLRSQLEFSEKISVLDAAKRSNSNLFINFNEEWFRNKVEKGEALFLIDGIDEVPSNQRQSAAQWIDDLAGWASSCPVVVTTRPLSDEPIFETEFQYAHLENMSHDDIERFVSYWHRAVSSGLLDEEITKRLNSSREKLLAAISSISSLRALATNPLMCAVLCAINLDRNCV
ncbi:NACHT domain-containing protein [Litoreibacter arenae]|uniref:Large ATP-binding protein n=1 Tax=Litoreibacter arenae DSM 19593 TaxID=1123360 RepID=S9QP45_9RHOB|nr:NACHT domain-containing protein [Litoreibacter arenae]EPX81368.1 large ATP-binding protein [Litoreibacter arenae DSM 19593]